MFNKNKSFFKIFLKSFYLFPLFSPSLHSSQTNISTTLLLTTSQVLSFTALFWAVGVVFLYFLNTALILCLCLLAILCELTYAFIAFIANQLFALIFTFKMQLNNIRILSQSRGSFYPKPRLWIYFYFLHFSSFFIFLFFTFQFVLVWVCEAFHKKTFF